MFLSRFCRRGVDFEKFYLENLKIMAGGVTPFAQQVQSLITSEKLELLATFFSILPFAEGFNDHHEGLHEISGLRIDKRGPTVETVTEQGGSLELLNTFISKAKCSAEEVVSQSPIKRFLAPSNAQAKEKAVKKKHDVENRFLEEVKDKGGIERKLTDSYKGSIDVNVDLLEVDPVLKSRVRHFHVQGLKAAMSLRFDPSLVCIVVRPSDIAQYDPKKPELSKYYVIQGVNSFRAIQELKKDGKMHLLPGLTNGLITVTLVNIEDTKLILFSHMRSNSLASAFIRKPKPQVRQILTSCFSGVT